MCTCTFGCRRYEHLSGFPLLTLRVLARAAQDSDLALFIFDTHARVFRTEVETPTRGPAINCTSVAAVAMESANAFAFLCLSTDSVRPAALAA